MKMEELEKSNFLKVPGLNEDQSENTSCEKKTTSMGTLYLPSSNDKISKKQTASVTKECDNQRQQITLCVLTLLQHCTANNKDYNILAVVLQPCHVKGVQTKSRPTYGCFPLATIVVLDQSEVKRKVLLWRNTAFWSLSIFPSDVIMLTNLTVCEENKKTLQSTFNSHLLNLGNCFTLIADKCSNIVDFLVLQELLNFVFTKHCYLKNLPFRHPQKLDCIQHVRLSQVQPEALVHSICKIVGISILKECTYNFKGLQQNRVILTVEVQGEIGTVILWGASVSWCEQIRMKRDHIWIFKYLFCKKSLISGAVELHTTPWSSCECLFHDDKRAIHFYKQHCENRSPSKRMRLSTFSEGRYSGDIDLKVSIIELKFYVPGNQSVLMNNQTSITKILNFLPLIIYSGCGKCSKELKIDHNYVYEQCLFCLPFNKVNLFYRSALITVRSDAIKISACISSDVLEKILLNISPNLLLELVSGSLNVRYGAIIADTCHSLLADNGESYLLKIKGHFSLDENSVPLEQKFHVQSLLFNI